MSASLFQELKRRNVFRVAAIYVVVSWLLMQIGDVMFPALHLPDWTQTLLVAFLLLGLPIALVFAWAFEVTPEGVVRTVEVPPEASITPHTGQKLNYMIIGTLALAVVMLLIKDLVFDERIEVPAIAVADKSIAVLPFKNQSASAENAEFFAGGLHDELLTLLSKLGQLKVISRTSVERLDPELSIPEIGALLGVATVLEGQVQRAGNRLRINVQLIDTANEGHLWANTYDSELTAENVFEVQGDIARTIAKALQAELSPSARKLLAEVPTRNTEALESYLLGAQYAKRATYDSLEAAIGYLQRAVKLDPEYAEAWAVYAEAYTSQLETGAISVEDFLRNAEPAVRNALRYNEELPDAHAQLGMVLWQKGETEAAELAFRHALELNPDSTASRHRYGYFLREMGRLQDALAILRPALDVDPLSVEIMFQIGKIEMYLGRPEINLEYAARMIAIAPASIYGRLAEMQSLVGMGRQADAFPAYLRVMELDPADYENWAHLAGQTENMGLSDLADRYLETAAELGPGQPSVLKNAVYIAVMRGELDKAWEIANAAITSGLDDRWRSDAAFLGVLLTKALAERDFEALLGHYRKRYPELFERAPMITSVNLPVTADLALLLQESGNAEAASAIIDAGLNYFEEVLGEGGRGFLHGLTDAKLLAVAGRNNEALEKIREALDAGSRAYWRFEFASNAFDSLRGEPEFTQMLLELEASTEAERQQVLALPDQGELDYRNK
jgi:TolB-like protein/Tfp pilus assembly protein PilF